MHVSTQKLLAGAVLSEDESFSLFESLIAGQLAEVEVSALLVALKIRGEQPEEVAGAAHALRAAAMAFARPDYRFADIVGTGGDGANTINISTAVSFVAAEAGLPIVKHGNRSVSSQCGSADLLEQFGVKLDMSPALARRCLDETGVTFLFAPHYHRGIRHAMPVRKALGTRTLFNLLGPLVNPACPPLMLVGVYDPALCTLVAQSLQLLGCERALVVNGLGLDEIALHGETQAAELIDGTIITRRFSPEAFGVREFGLTEILGAGPEHNARAIAALLGGEGQEAHRAAVSVNAGALLQMAGLVDSYAQGYELSQSILKTGKAYARLEAFSRASRSES